MRLNILPEDNLPTAVGKAVMTYAEVEGAQSELLATLLSISQARADVLFYSLQNVRSRIEVIELLLGIDHGEKFDKYWASCGSFLQTLARFRNALAHWHPIGIMRLQPPAKTPEEAAQRERDSFKPMERGLYDPSNKKFRVLIPTDLVPFIADCSEICQELYMFASYLTQHASKPNEPLSRKFQQPISCRNQAVLRRYQTPTAPRPPRPPSTPSPQKRESAAQRRKRAIALAARKKK